MDFKHVPVLYEECLEGLAIKTDGIYVDGTLGEHAMRLELEAGSVKKVS